MKGFNFPEAPCRNYVGMYLHVHFRNKLFCTFSGSFTYNAGLAGQELCGLAKNADDLPLSESNMTQ